MNVYISLINNSVIAMQNSIVKTPEERINNLEKLQKIGEGTYGVVYKCRDRQTGELLAWKKCKSADSEEGIPSTTLREIIALRSLNHKNIIATRDVIIRDDKIDIIMDFKTSDLKCFMDNMKHGDMTLCKHIFYQLLLGVQYLHKNHWVHRDIKPQNILVDMEMKNNNTPVSVQLADLGLSRLIPINRFPTVNQTYTHEVCTLWYRPPEILLGHRHYNHTIDVWSLACTFIEVFTRVPFLTGDCELDQIFRTFRVLGTPTLENKLWPALFDLSTRHKFPNFKTEFPKWKKQSLVNTLKVKHQQPRTVSASACSLCEDQECKNLDPITQLPLCRDCWLLNDLLTLMLSMDPKFRPSAARCVAHPFFRDIAHLYKEQ